MHPHHSHQPGTKFVGLLGIHAKIDDSLVSNKGDVANLLAKSVAEIFSGPLILRDLSVSK